VSKPSVAVGEVWAYEVRPGRAVLFRAVAADDDATCVVLTRWEGPTPRRAPRSNRVHEVQPLTHHEFDRPMIGGWVKTPPPASVRAVGVVPLAEGEAGRVVHPRDWVNAPKKTAALGKKVLPFFSWDTLLRDALAQWRWEHEKKTVLAEDAKSAGSGFEALQAALQRNRRSAEREQKRGIAGLQGKRFFAAWKDHAPAELIDALEAAVAGALVSLEGKRERAAVAPLMSLVRTFNALDGRAGHSFDAGDADDLVAIVERLGRASGMSPALVSRHVLVLCEF